MIFPPKWNRKRPGLLIPVFFLCMLHLKGQSVAADCSALALGGTFVSRSGTSLPQGNQAGLGDVERTTLSIHHVRPFLAGDLGISSLSIQAAMTHGALGASLIHWGIAGLRHTSFWMAYGIRLSSGWLAGVGIHGWSKSTGEQLLHHPGFSFAAGVQWKVHDRFRWGSHLAHAAGWQSGGPGHHALPLKLAMGGSLLVVQGITFHLEVVFISGNTFGWRSGMEWDSERGFLMQFGLRPDPLTVSWGCSFIHQNWILQAAVAFGQETGVTPSTALTRAW